MSILRSYVNDGMPKVMGLKHRYKFWRAAGRTRMAWNAVGKEVMMLRILGSLFVFVALSCAIPPPHQVTYLQSAVDHATQDDVAKRLGAPALTVALTDGGSVWTYRYPTGIADVGVGTASSRCEDLILTFDQRHVLRKWLQQSCSLEPGT